MKTLILSLALLCFAAFAAEDASPLGDFSEGVVKLEKADLEKFLSWAVNAKNTLDKALLEVNRKKIEDKLGFLEGEIKSVVNASGERQYQRLMRYSLNRGLHLVKLLKEESVGLPSAYATLNGIEIYRSSIRLALAFYESDLSYQNRAQNSESVKIALAYFGKSFYENLFPLASSLIDATAQYKLMRKILEVLAWDLANDIESIKYSSVILEIENTMDKLPENPGSDTEAIESKRELSYLVTKIGPEISLIAKPVGVPEIKPVVPGSAAALPNSFANFVRISAGRFTMGSANNEAGRNSDETQHEVIISRDFLLQTTETTQAQWKEIMGANKNPSRFKVKGDNLPVESVSWDTVTNEFIKKLNEKLNPGLDCSTFEKARVTSGCFRLPTEAEWEYAARANTSTAYSFGNNSSDLDKYAWYGSNSNGTTHPVGTKAPNLWGLYDMHGNVWEWTQDDWDSSGYSKHSSTDPLRHSGGVYRVLRGGSWNFNAQYLRSGYRSLVGADGSYGYIGFRLVRTL